MRYQLYVDGILRSEFIYRNEAIGEAIRLYRRHNRNIEVVDEESKNVICCFK